MTLADQAPQPGTPAPPGPGRRTFLRATGAACGVTALTAFARTSDGTAVARVARRAVSGAARPAGPTPADWNALARDLSGHLVRPGAAGYDTARRLFDPRFDGIRPAGIAYCRSPHDVATCLAFARKYGVPVAARSGGHSYAGWSSTTGLIVDVTGMSSVQVNTASGTVSVGSGTRLIDMYNGLAAHGRAVPGGSCPTVGIAGLTPGGHGIRAPERAVPGPVHDRLAVGRGRGRGQ